MRYSRCTPGKVKRSRFAMMVEKDPKPDKVVGAGSKVSVSLG